MLQCDLYYSSSCYVVVQLLSSLVGCTVRSLLVVAACDLCMLCTIAYLLQCAPLRAHVVSRTAGALVWDDGALSIAVLRNALLALVANTMSACALLATSLEWCIWP